ncbi:MAG TPA: hypothetical protein VFU46_04500, partial [Gemmatimonadales bacterium]|nr:hypothetical protein [Gemmatimonadales bacterium]
MMLARRALVSAFVAAACSSAPEVETAPRPAPQPAQDGGGAPAAVPSGRGAGVLYRPAPLSPYLLQRRDSLTLQLPGGASQAQQFTRTAFLGVTVQGREPPYEVAIKLDSVRQEGGLVPPDSLHRAEGTHWVGSLSANGKLGDLRADRLSTVGDQIGATLPTLFPALP